MALTRADLQRLLPGIAIASLVMITVSVLLLVSLRTDRPPKAVMVLSREMVHPGEVIVLDAMNSSDPDGGPLRYRWSIDGSIFSSADRWSYMFPSTGVHTVELKVTDDEGSSDQVSATVQVVPWPEEGMYVVPQQAINNFLGFTIQ
jgi:hypothetical protein